MQTYKVVLRNNDTMYYASYQAKNKRELEKLVRVAFPDIYRIVRMVVQ